MPKIKVISSCLDSRGKGFQVGKVLEAPEGAPKCDKYFIRYKGVKKKDNVTFYVTLQELAVIAFVCINLVAKFMEE